MVFVNRVDAGRQLAERLRRYQGPDVVVLGLPRGGVPVAFEVALGAPLDVIVVRKLGVPFQPELAMGALGEDDTLVLNKQVVTRTGVSEDELAEAKRRERAEVQRLASQPARRSIALGAPTGRMPGPVAGLLRRKHRRGGGAIRGGRAGRGHRRRGLPRWTP